MAKTRATAGTLAPATVDPVTVADIWLRASSDKQDEQNQIARVTAYIEAHGYTTGRTWVAHDKSATKREHLPLLREAIAAMASGLSDVLVIRNTDRIDRTEELGMILREVEEVGGRIESVEEPWVAELSGLGGKLMTGVAEYMNAEYVKKLSGNVLDAQARRRASGSYASGFAPRGYVIVGRHADGMRHPKPGKCQSCYPDRGGNKTLEPNDDAVIIRRIFTAVAGGDSYETVARSLHADSVPTRGGGPWGAGVIGQIVRNTAYRGHVQHDGVTYMTVEPIVSAVLWRDANNAVAARARGAGKGGGRKSRSFLRPRCGRCGGPMYVYDARTQYARYRCAGLGPAGTTAQGQACGNTIKMGLLDAEVTAAFEAADDPEIEETVISGSDYAEEIAQAQLAIKDLADDDDYDERHAALRAELRRLRMLPSQPARVVKRRTGRTEGDAFKAMTLPERQAFIRLWTLTVMPKDAEIRWTLTRPNGALMAPDPRALVDALKRGA